MKCTRCQAPNHVFIRRSERCTCGAEGGEFAPDAEHESRGCQMALDWVVKFVHPDVMRDRDLLHDADRTHGLRLPISMRSWTLEERLDREGRPVLGQYVRTKYLCRDCIVVEQQIDQQVKEHDRAWKRQREKGKSQSFTESLCSQDYL